MEGRRRTRLHGGNRTTTTITDLAHDTEYKIRMRARYYRGEHEGKSWGGPWATATTTVAGEPAEPPTPEPVQQPAKEDPVQQQSRDDPDPPAGTIDTLAATDDAAGQLLLTWEAPAAPNADPTDYHVNWAKSTEEYPANTAEAGNAHPTDTTLTLTVLEFDTDYNVRVRARYSDGENAANPWNGPWTETTAQVKLPLPEAPFIGAIAVSPDREVLLTWFNSEENNSITGYQVLRGPDADSLAVIEDDTGSTSTSYTDTAPPAGQTHTYGVKARNASGLSPLSDTATATVPAAEEEPAVSARQNQELFLVSNLDASTSGVLTLSFYQVTSTARTAQSFSAAHNADGSSAEFDFHAITVLLEGAGGQTASLAASDLLVTVHSDTSGQPGDLLYTLIPPVPLTVLGDGGPVTFTAPPSSTLSSGIPYWLKLEAAAASTFFGGNFIFVQRAGDGSEVQGPTTDNRWTIGDSSLTSRQVLSWQTDHRVVKMSVLGLQLAAPLVSNLGQTSAAPIQIFDDKGAAQAFVAAPGPFDFGYHFQGIRVSARGFVFSGELLIPQVRASLHGDSGGIPGARLHTLTMPLDFASTENLTDYTLLAPPGTVLRGGARYWVVFEVLINNLYLEATNSADEDPRLEAWSIDNESYTKQASGWVIRPRVIKLAVLGSPQWVTNEADGPDLPGAGHNAHQTNGVVTPGIVSTGHLTAGLDYDHGHSGDYWWLETQRGHSYRVEVEFGDRPNNDTGGSAWMSFIDPDHDDYPYASGCCEADHNRDDGHTFVHFYRPTDDWNNRYLINVAAFDKLNHNSRIYNGPYTITMTDITGTEKVATNLYLGTRIESTLPEIDEGVKYAVSFTTGDHSAGYKLDRVRIHVPYHEGQPDLVLHANTSGLPGDGICDLLEPNKVQHHRPYTADNALPVPFRAAHCGSEAFLDANTTYWLVLEGTDYETVFTDSSDQQTRGSGWTIGDRAATSIVGSWGNLASNWGTIPVEIWAKKLNNPLSVSLEVTSDPTHGTDSDTYGAGDVITFEVKFSEAVTITGTPRLRFKISGTGDDYAPYLSGSGTNTLVFAYTVLATDADTNGIFLYNRPLSYPDADADTIVAVDDNLPVIDKITGQIRTLSGHKINGTITN